MKKFLAIGLLSYIATAEEIVVTKTRTSNIEVPKVLEVKNLRNIKTEESSSACVSAKDEDRGRDGKGLSGRSK